MKLSSQMEFGRGQGKWRRLLLKVASASHCCFVQFVYPSNFVPEKSQGK